MQAQHGGRSEDVQISRARIEEQRAQVEQLRAQINQTLIKAPDDGLISKRNAHIGDIAAVGQPLYSMIRANRLELRAQATDTDLPKFHIGQRVRVSTDEGTTGDIIGSVRLVSPQVDPITRLGNVRIDLPPNSGLKPGMFVRGEVELGRRQAMTVPVDAVVTRNGESFVFTLQGDRVTSRPVKLGAQTASFCEITSGLDANSLIVVKGARFLSDNDVVRVSR
jgi:RND family efflux transporter MFP subunit